MRGEARLHWCLAIGLVWALSALGGAALRSADDDGQPQETGSEHRFDISALFSAPRREPVPHWPRSGRPDGGALEFAACDDRHSIGASWHSAQVSRLIAELEDVLGPKAAWPSIDGRSLSLELTSAEARRVRDFIARRVAERAKLFAFELLRVPLDSLDDSDERPAALAKLEALAPRFDVLSTRAGVDRILLLARDDDIVSHGGRATRQVLLDTEVSQTGSFPVGVPVVERIPVGLLAEIEPRLRRPSRGAGADTPRIDLRLRVGTFEVPDALETRHTYQAELEILSFETVSISTRLVVRPDEPFLIGLASDEAVASVDPDSSSNPGSDARDANATDSASGENSGRRRLGGAVWLGRVRALGPPHSASAPVAERPSSVELTRAVHDAPITPRRGLYEPDHRELGFDAAADELDDEAMADALRALVGPERVDEDRFELSVAGGRVSLLSDAAGHAALRDAIESWNDAHSSRLTLETLAVESDTATLRALADRIEPGGLLPRDLDPLASGLRVLAHCAVEGTLGDALDVQAWRGRSFVDSYELLSGHNSLSIPDPVVELAGTGSRLRARVDRAVDGLRVDLELLRTKTDFERSGLQSLPVDDRVPVRPRREVLAVVDLPDTDVLECSPSLLTQPGRWSLAQLEGDGTRSRALLVRVRTFDHGAEAGPHASTSRRIMPLSWPTIRTSPPARVRALGLEDSAAALELEEDFGQLFFGFPESAVVASGLNSRLIARELRERDISLHGRFAVGSPTAASVLAGLVRPVERSELASAMVEMVFVPAEALDRAAPDWIRRETLSTEEVDRALAISPRAAHRARLVPPGRRVRVSPSVRRRALLRSAIHSAHAFPSLEYPVSRLPVGTLAEVLILPTPSGRACRVDLLCLLSDAGFSQFARPATAFLDRAHATRAGLETSIYLASSDWVALGAVDLLGPSAGETEGTRATSTDAKATPRTPDSFVALLRVRLPPAPLRAPQNREREREDTAHSRIARLDLSSLLVSRPDAWAPERIFQPPPPESLETTLLVENARLELLEESLLRFLETSTEADPLPGIEGGTAKVHLARRFADQIQIEDTQVVTRGLSPAGEEALILELDRLVASTCDVFALELTEYLCDTESAVQALSASTLGAVPPGTISARALVRGATGQDILVESLAATSHVHGHERSEGQRGTEIAEVSAPVIATAAEGLVLLVRIERTDTPSSFELRLRGARAGRPTLRGSLRAEIPPGGERVQPDLAAEIELLDRPLRAWSAVRTLTLERATLLRVTPAAEPGRSYLLVATLRRTTHATRAPDTPPGGDDRR